MINVNLCLCTLYYALFEGLPQKRQLLLPNAVLEENVRWIRYFSNNAWMLVKDVNVKT